MLIKRSNGGQLTETSAENQQSQVNIWKLNSNNPITQKKSIVSFIHQSQILCIEKKSKTKNANCLKY